MYAKTLEEEQAELEGRQLEITNQYQPTPEE